jgi:hypothetical protein
VAKSSDNVLHLHGYLSLQSGRRSQRLSRTPARTDVGFGSAFYGMPMEVICRGDDSAGSTSQGLRRTARVEN